MVRINSHHLTLPGSYLFSEIAARVAAYAEAHPDADLIRLGIGDVTQPLPPAVIQALADAVREQSTAVGFHGYGPEQGYLWLRETICRCCYGELAITPDEVFVSDGAKSDIGNFQEIFAPDCVIAVTDPVYPVYVDSNVMAGRAGAWRGGAFEKILYLPCTDANNFVPELPEQRPDLIYLCFPNNPTGAVLTREQLAQWVSYAKEHDCVILFDAAYEAFIRDPSLPRSIYEISGAKEVAIEFRSYSKTAGFTGLRCGFTVVPKEAKGTTSDGKKASLNAMWLRRQATKFNGCPYLVQKAAEAVHSAEGQRQTSRLIDTYLNNAKRIRSVFQGIGIPVSGGDNSPYVWVTLPDGRDSWSFFEKLLNEAEIVGTPGVGFGPCGEGHFRFTGFGDPTRTREAVERLGRLSFF